MKKYLKSRVVLVSIAVALAAFNVTLVFMHYYDSAVIALTPKAGPDVSAPRIRPEQIEKVKKITVLISNEGFGGASRGTGILLDDVHVLTCAHLIDSYEDDLWVYTYDGEFVKGKPLIGDKRLDLAIVLLDRSVKRRQKPVFQEKVHPGEPVAIIGNALGAMKWYVSGGIVSGTHKDWILTDGFQIGGNSGGPWINNKGEIIAIAAWGLQNRDGSRVGINGGIGSKAVNKFVEEFRHPKPNFFSIIMGAVSNSKAEPKEKK